MVDQLLATKQHIPAVRIDAVPRPRLYQILDGVLEGKLALVSATAGYGKSTLVANWLKERKHPAAWLSLDQWDNDPLRFWRAVITTLQTVEPSLGIDAATILTTGGPSQLTPALVTLLNDLTTHPKRIMLVLDDVHTVENGVVHESLQFLLDNQPATLHLILLTRIDPPLRLSKLRVQHQLVELRAGDLAFTPDETRVLLNEQLGLSLDRAQVEALYQRTEGWVTGLQLAALALQGVPEPETFVREFAGSQQVILDYLTEEVLSRLPEQLRTFLMETAVLDRLSPSLCAAVTQHPESHSLFDTIRQQNLFLIPLDHKGEWYRYHHLFADLLQARLLRHLLADQLATRHLRASQWYEENGLLAEAIQHAVQAEKQERAAALVDRAGRTLISRDHTTLRLWLEQLPEAVFLSHPRLAVYRTLIALSQGRLDMSEQTLLEAKALVDSLPAGPENEELRLEALAYLTLFLAHQNTALTIQIAEETLASIPEGALRLRAFLFSALYRAYGMQGELEQATPAYRECFRLSQALKAYGMLSVTTMVRAFDLCQYGQLDEAAQACQAIIEAGPAASRGTFYPAGPSYIGLAGIQLERYQLALAEEHLTRGLMLCEESGMDGLYTGWLQKARLLQAKGELTQAAAVLHRLEQKLQRWDFTLVARQVSLRRALGDAGGLSRMLPGLLAVLENSAYARKLPLIAQEAFKLSLAHIYVAQNELDIASRLLAEIEATAAPAERNGRLLEIALLRAQIQQQAAPHQLSPQAIAYLEKALGFGEASGFVLLFLEAGSSLRPLLQQVTHHTAYARRLLSLLKDDPLVPQSGAAAGLVERLTPREMEVLHQIALGDSNRVIAEKLYITERTVKKHITNILGKLDAHNRTQAVAKAREHGLLALP